MIEKEVIINNFKIRYIEKRNTDEVVFVFLHGWGSHYKSFLPIYQELNNYIAFDFPGFGGSSKLKKPLQLLDYTILTKSFIDQKLYGKKVVFVTHSFGGRVLLQLLNQKNKINIRQIVCIGVPFTRKYGLKKKLIYVITKIFKVIFFILPKPILNRIKKIWYKMIDANDYIAVENEIMKKTFQNIINEDISKLAYILKNYKTDFIWGDNDREAPLSEAIVISKKIGAQLHIIENGGHFPFVGKTTEKFKTLFDQITYI